VKLTSRRSVALALAYRQAKVLIKNPSLFLPPMLFPLMSFLAFAGGLSRLTQVPGFKYEGGYTSFVFVFVLLQSAAFSGVFMGFNVARDFETGFARRLMIAVSHRSGLIAGYALAALLRWIVVAVVLTVVALIAQMPVGGDGIDIVGMYTLAAILNFAGVLFSSGIALRMRSTQGAPLMQTPVFLALFLAPVYVPLVLLEGWIHAVATGNPVTYLLEAGRGFLAGNPEQVLLAFACGAGLVAFFLIWAFRGLKRAERAAG
jgi:ABC-type multidrug transport system permease subunit